jgi:hypothetical protein
LSEKKKKKQKMFLFTVSFLILSALSASRAFVNAPCSNEAITKARQPLIINPPNTAYDIYIYHPLVFKRSLFHSRSLSQQKKKKKKKFAKNHFF